MKLKKSDARRSPDGAGSPDDLVTVVIPTYNRGRLAERAARSALAQSHDHIEVLVIDDCSSDDTLDRLKAINDPRLHLLRHPENRGACAARNAGISEARGEFVAFLDSDDEWKPKKVESQLNSLRRSSLRNAGAVITGSELIDDRTGDVTPRVPQPRGNVFDDLLQLESLCGPGSTVLVERNVLDGIRWDERLPMMQDRDFMLQIARKVAVEVDPAALVRIHRNHGSGHIMNVTRVREALEYLACKYSAEYESRPYALRLFRRRAAHFCRRGGDAAGVRKFLAPLLREDPADLSSAVWFALACLGPTGLRIPQALLGGR